MFFFFFKQKTAYEMRISDWSSDVCSSDLALLVARDGALRHKDAVAAGALHHFGAHVHAGQQQATLVRELSADDLAAGARIHGHVGELEYAFFGEGAAVLQLEDRKSTRLNSSH